MTNLCEILIYELELTGDEQILKEIDALINRLLEIAESEYLYALLAETYFFKSKVSLLHLDIENSRQLLIKAQKIAKEHDLNRLAKKISNEQDSLLMNLDEWEKKIEKNTPMSSIRDTPDVSSRYSGSIIHVITFSGVASSEDGYEKRIFPS